MNKPGWFIWTVKTELKNTGTEYLKAINKYFGDWGFTWTQGRNSQWHSRQNNCNRFVLPPNLAFLNTKKYLLKILMYHLDTER